jgi:hypothetical protein
LKVLNYFGFQAIKFSTFFVVDLFMKVGGGDQRFIVVYEVNIKFQLDFAEGLFV